MLPIFKKEDRGKEVKYLADQKKDERNKIVLITKFVFFAKGTDNLYRKMKKPVTHMQLFLAKNTADA